MDYVEMPRYKCHRCGGEQYRPMDEPSPAELHVRDVRHDPFRDSYGRAVLVPAGRCRGGMSRP